MTSPTSDGGVGPALRVLGLVGLAVAAVLSDSWWVLGSLAVIPLLWWVAHGQSVFLLLTLLRRTWFLMAMLILSFLIMPPESQSPWLVVVGGRTLNLSGLAPGAQMSLRLLTIILGSLALRETGRPDDILVGLRQLKLPLPVAQTIHTSLALLGDRRGASRRRGRRRAEDALSGSGGFLTRMRNRKDALAGRLMASLDETIARSEAEIRRGPASSPHEPAAVSDAAVVSALAVMSMTVKFVKILPGIPFAPGHKNVLIFPLYFAAARLTRSRLGGTWMGVTLGMIAFMFGEGRFGILEAIKYIGPGVVVDASWPLVRKLPHVALYSALGLLMSVAWFGATLLMGWIAQAPPLFYAIAGAASVTQLAAGVLSGPVAWALVKALAGAPIASGSSQGGAGLASSDPTTETGRRFELRREDPCREDP